MNPLYLVFAWLIGSYLLLRNICLSGASKRQPVFMIFLAGFVSWLFITSIAAWILLTLYLFYILFQGSFGAIVGLVINVFMVGIMLKFKEALDSAAVFYYLRDTAFFRPMKPKTMIAQEELDKKEILDVHRATSSKPFPQQRPAKRLLTDQEIQTLHRELKAIQQRPKRSNQYDEEIRSLSSGTTMRIADPWKVYTFTNKRHDWYAEMSDLEIEPASRTLRFRINIPDATSIALGDALFVFRIKQDLYHLLQVLNSDPWILWYTEYVDRFQALLYGLETDSFGHQQLFPFMKIVIDRPALLRLDGKFFNAADLHKISTLVFNNGQPLSDTP